MALGITFAACGELPDVEHDVCGNGVLEPGEACDTFATLPPGAPDPLYEGDARTLVTRCGEPSTAAACSYVWSNEGDADRAVCPANFAAGVDGLCRMPTFTFDSNSRVVDVAGSSLDVGDFDGDGLEELVVMPSLPSQATVVSFDTALRERSQSYVSLNGFAPTITQLTSEGPSSESPNERARADLVVSNVTGISLLTGASDGQFDAHPFATLNVFAGSEILAVPGGVLAGLGMYDDATVGLASVLDAPGFMTNGGTKLQIFGVLGTVGLPDLIAEIPGTKIEPVSVLSFEWDPSEVNDARVEEMLVAYRQGDNPRVRIVTPAVGPQPPDGLPVPLPGVTAFAGKPFVIGQSGSVGIPVKNSVGDYEVRVIHPAPSVPITPVPVETIALPQNLGLLNDVVVFGAMDLNPEDAVSADLIFASVGLFARDEDASYKPIATAPPLTPWTEGAFLGPYQVVAAGPQPGLDVLTFTGGVLATPARVATAQPLSDLSIGDFDGDGLQDLVAIERSISEPRCDVEEDVVVFWGSLTGLPSAPRRIATVPGPSRIVVGSLMTVAAIDDVDDFGLSLACTDENGTFPAGIFIGGASRQLTSRVPILDEFAPSSLGHNVLANVMGDASPDVVALAYQVPVFENTNNRDGWFSVATSEGSASRLFTIGSLNCGPSSSGAGCVPPPTLEAKLNATPEAVANYRFAFGSVLAGRLVAIPGAEGDYDKIVLVHADLRGDVASDKVEVRTALRPIQLEDPGASPFAAESIVPDIGESIPHPKVMNAPRELEWIVQAASNATMTADVLDVDGNGTQDVMGLFVARTLHGPKSQLVAFLDAETPVAVRPTFEDETLDVTGFASAKPLYAPGQEVTRPLVVTTARHIFLCSIVGSALECDQVLLGGSETRPLEPASSEGYDGVKTGDFDGDGGGDLAILQRSSIRVYRQLMSDGSPVTSR